MNQILLKILIIVSAFLPKIINAQNSIGTELKAPYSMSLGYWGSDDLAFQLGLEIKHLQNIKYRHYSYLSILTNRKTDVYSSLGIRIGSSFNRVFKSGYYFEYGVFCGYLASKYDFELYGLKNGDIVNKGRSWYHSAIGGFNLGVGYDLSAKTSRGARIFIKPNIYYRLPNNDNMPFINSFLLEIGCAFDFRSKTK